jgi:hypothetical protein
MDNDSDLRGGSGKYLFLAVFLARFNYDLIFFIIESSEDDNIMMKQYLKNESLWRASYLLD